MKNHENTLKTMVSICFEINQNCNYKEKIYVERLGLLHLENLEFLFGQAEQIP